MEENKTPPTAKISPLRPKGAWWIRQGDGSWGWQPPTVSRAKRKLIKARRKQGAWARRKNHGKQTG